MVNNDFELLSNLLERLRSGGYHLFFAEEVPPQDLRNRAKLWPWLARFETLSASPILTLCFQMQELHAAFKALHNLESKLIEDRIKVAHKHLNHVKTSPSLSHQAAKEVEFLRKNSLVQGDSSLWSDTFQLTEATITSFVNELLQKQMLKPKELNFTHKREVLNNMLQLWHWLMHSTRCVQTVLRYQAENFPKQLTPEFSELLKNLQFANLDQTAEMMLFKEDLQNTAFYTVSWLNQLNMLHTHLENKSKFDKFSHERNADELKINNETFADRLSQCLISQGENYFDVQKFKTALIEYAQKHTVLCQDILDNELEKLSINISKESLHLAKQEIRLNDLDYPLSTAHRDWVLQICPLPRQ